MKIITLHENNETDYSTAERNKLDLIEAISNATNRQTPVINADKNSNEKNYVALQKILFDYYGILYERKRGEFEDGLHNGYINESQIIERNLLLRIYFAVIGNIKYAKQKRLFQNYVLPDTVLSDKISLDKLNIGLFLFDRLWGKTKKYIKITQEGYLKLFFYANYIYDNKKDLNDYDNYLDEMKSEYNSFISYYNNHCIISITKKKRNKITGAIIEKIIYKHINDNLNEVLKKYQDYKI